MSDLSQSYQPDPISGNFYGKNILTIEQFSRKDLDQLFQAASEFKKQFRAKNFDKLRLADNYLAAVVFFEPSTRTDLSFQTAMSRLGGSVISASNGINFSSVYKGEDLADTIRTAGCYADIIILRHPVVGSAVEAAYYTDSLLNEIGRKPIIINGGDGDGEHPTQALLDLFTIFEKKKTVDNLSITLVGDLKYGRTVHSLAKLFAIYGLKNATLNLVSPDSLQLPESIRDYIKSSFKLNQTQSVESVIGQSDVIYWTRIQEERFDNQADYDLIKNDFIMTPALLNQTKQNSILMHPLPRKHEMGDIYDRQALDQDDRSVYFQQMENGVFIRMALLALTLGLYPKN